MAQEIYLMHIPGIHIEREFKRYYPLAQVASHIVGFTNVDGKGQEGLELEFNKFLTGTDGYFEYKRICMVVWHQKRKINLLLLKMVKTYS